MPAVKWTGGTAAALFVALALMVSSAYAIPTTLLMSEARTEAQNQATTFTLRHDLTESHVARCKRRSADNVGCTAIAKGETSSATVVCRLAVTVRLVRHRFYNSTAAAITKHRCAKTPKEQLTYQDALAAIQSAADKFAGTPTSITYMFRRDDLTYKGTAEWERPGASIGFGVVLTEHCSVDLVASLAEGKVSVATEGFSCY